MRTTSIYLPVIAEFLLLIAGTRRRVEYVRMVADLTQRNQTNKHLHKKLSFIIICIKKNNLLSKDVCNATVSHKKKHTL